MPKPRKARRGGAPHHPGTRPADHLTILFRLWRLFEHSGAVSAYIAYRLQLSRVVRATSSSSGEPPQTFPSTR